MWMHFVTGRAHKQDQYSQDFSHVTVILFWLAFGQRQLTIATCMINSHNVGSHLQAAHMWKKFCEHNSRSVAHKKYALRDSFQHKNSQNLAFVVTLEKHTGALPVFSYCRSITVFCASGFRPSSLCQLCVMPNMLQLQSSKKLPLASTTHINFLWCKHFDAWLTVHCLFKDCQFCPLLKWWQSSLRGAFTGALVHLHLLLKVLSQKQSRSTSTLLTTVQVSHWNIPFIVQLIVIKTLGG